MTTKALIFAIVQFFVGACHRPISQPPDHMTREYQRSVTYLRDTVVPLAKILEVAFGETRIQRDSSFSEVFRNPTHYQVAATSLMTSPELSRKEKNILVFMMQGLSITDLIKFFNGCFHLYKKGLIDEGQLGLVLTPGPGYENKIIESYHAPELQGIFQEMEKEQSLSFEFRTGVAEIRSGMTARHLKETQNGIGIGPNGPQRR